jgi:hypothetical protein
MTLPTRDEINIHDSLDERSACEHFLGKTQEQAEALFRENSLYYQEDLMFMGASAFRFYVQALIRYIRSEAATDDSDIINCFAGILEHRLAHEAEELRPAARRLGSICGYILEHYERFDLTPDIYGDLRPRFQALQQAFSNKDEVPLRLRLTRLQTRMAEKPTFAELERRVRRAISEHGGSLPGEDAIAWSGYFAGLLEWGLITADDHKRLTDLLPKIANNPTIRIFLGYDE